MKVFISWSGKKSKRLAEVLREWLPSVLHDVDPWFSSQDIGKGKRWSDEVAGELQASSAGIVCVTPENLHSEWLHFESGAIAKSVGYSYVCTYLFEVDTTDLSAPLSQFQATSASFSDTRKLIETLNQASERAPLPEQRLVRTFEKWWPDLEEELKVIRNLPAQPRITKSDRQILEELLALAKKSTSN